MTVRLYAIPLSHPVWAIRLMLAYKGIEYDDVELLSGFHPLLLRLRGFRDGTVPALRIDGRRIQGSRSISRALEELQPEPPLYPAPVDRRRLVEDAERWGEATLQPVPRRLARWALVRHSGFREELARMNELPLPVLSAMLMKPLAARFASISHADDATVRADLAGLPELLDRVDSLIAEGTIGGSVPNAADFQIATSVRVLLAFDDLREEIRDRPAADLALRLMPDYPARLPPVFPARWLAR